MSQFRHWLFPLGLSLSGPEGPPRPTNVEMFPRIQRKQTPKDSSPRRKIFLRWQKQADKLAPTLPRGQAEPAQATESQEWCPRSPPSVGQSMWASQGLPCRCFSQDTSHVTQIAAQGHENKDHFRLWEVSTLTGEKEELWNMQGQDRNVTKEGDDEHFLMIRKETPQPQPCGGFPRPAAWETCHLSESQRPECSLSCAWLASSRNVAQSSAWLCLFSG